MSTPSPIGFFERYLSLWVALCSALPTHVIQTGYMQGTALAYEKVYAMQLVR